MLNNRVAHPTISRIELHPIETQTLSDDQFLSGTSGDTQVTIAGELRLPEGDQKMPAVILLHGSSGYLSYLKEWVEIINGMGIATFVIDSLTGRGLRKVGDKQGDLGRLASVFDAYRALDLLAEDDRIDEKKIVLMGFSRGGQASLYASLIRFHNLYLQRGNEFAAYISFYPNCVTTYLDDEKVVDKPIRIFHGEADDYNPFANCKSYVKRLKAAGVDVGITGYPGAYHSFDYDKFKEPVKSPQLQSARNCKLEEIEPGKIINTVSGEKFTYADPCVELGVTLGYDAEATKAAQSSVRELLSRWLLE